MPREHRKRGKKHKKEQEPEETRYEEAPQDVEEYFEPQDPTTSSNDAPFGFVDPDVKAYFRTVETQLKEWQDDFGDVEEDVDLKDDRRNFLVAALSEMSGKELQLATDPDCAAIVERMIHSMDDILKRVFVDRLSGSFEQLMKHRFASHVCQTIFSVSGTTVARELRGILPAHPDATDGQLRNLTELILDVCEEILPHCSTFVNDAFASHVLRAILVLLCPSISPPPVSGDKDLRSKKSAAFKAKQGPMKSIFNENERADHDNYERPAEFTDMARRLLDALKRDLGENEVRAIAADKVGSPTLKLVIELEAHLDECNNKGSFMDHVLFGLVSASLDHTSAEQSDYLTSILYDTTASHLLETLVHRAPLAVFGLLWSTYFQGKLAKLAVHPVANFVVARAIDRLDADQLDDALEELAGTWVKMRKTARLGVLKALVDRAAELGLRNDGVVNAVRIAFDVNDAEDKGAVVLSILRLKTPGEYREVIATAARQTDDTLDERPAKRRKQSDADPMEPRIQGALLLQSLLHLPDPYYAFVTDSLMTLQPRDLIELAHHPISSRVLDEAFAPRVPALVRKKLVGQYIGHFHELADDRIGSRVAERAWAAVDTYLKEKIARSLLPHEAFLTGSHYGRFFARAVNLSLFNRRPDDWRRAQAQAQAQVAVSNATAVGSATPAPNAAPAHPVARELVEAPPTKKKRKRHEDEIDELFAKKGKTIADAGTRSARAKPEPATREADEDRVQGRADVDDAVLRAIRTAPNEVSHKSGKKR